MCDPISMTAATLAVVGAGMGAWSASNAGKAQEQQYRMMAEQQAAAALAAEETGELNSGLAQDAAMEQTRQLNRDVKRVQGAQKAAAGASGIAGSVTAQDIAMDTMDQAKLDELAIRYNADMAAFSERRSAQQSAWDLRYNAAMNQGAGRYAKQASRFGVVSSLLDGAQGVTGAIGRYQMRKASATKAG